MENESVSKNKKKYNNFWIGIMVSALLAGCLFAIYAIYTNNQESKIKAEQERIAKERAGIVADSLRIVNENKLRYQKMVTFINTRDSIRSLLRYKIGDVVYLKPDSVRCVIMDISSDSTLSSYSYFLISNNKNIEPGLLIRNDKLIY